MRPVQIRRVELDAHPAARPAAVYAAALEQALRWQCDVRVRTRESSFEITYLAAQQAAADLAQKASRCTSSSVDSLPPENPAQPGAVP